MTGVLLKRKAEEILRPLDIEQEVMGRQGQRLVWCVRSQGRPRIIAATRSQKGGREQTLPQSSQRKPVLVKTWSRFQASRTVREKCAVAWSHTHFVVIYGDGHGKLIHTPSQHFPPGSLWSNLHPCLSDLVLSLLLLPLFFGCDGFTVVSCLNFTSRRHFPHIFTRLAASFHSDPCEKLLLKEAFPHHPA